MDHRLFHTLKLGFKDILWYNLFYNYVHLIVLQCDAKKKLKNYTAYTIFQYGFDLNVGYNGKFDQELLIS